MKKYISILNAMTVIVMLEYFSQPLQLAKPNTIKAMDRIKLAKDTELVLECLFVHLQTVEYVNKVLRMYEQQYGSSVISLLIVSSL